jgi:hypothetical protein
MTETNKDKQLFTVGRVFFLLIVIPLSLMAVLIANGLFKLGVTFKERAVMVLDQKSQEEIKIRAINIADDIATFLKEREKDLMISTIIPPTDAAFKKFVQENKRAIWIKENDKIRQVMANLYSEMSLIDKNGNEQIKILNGEVVPKVKLLNVTNVANTTYKSEDYFLKTKSLGKGETYVSSVTGSYVNRSEFDKGKRFSGIIRFATPLFDKNGFSGVIMLALDYRHLAGFTDHVVPTQAEYVYEADAASGNYAYMVNNKGFVISHPNDYHIEGLNKEGKLVPAITEADAANLPKKDEQVLNLNFLGFMDPNLPEVAKEAAQGKSGLKMYKFGERTKFVAFAPIKFYSADFPKPAGFGWVGLGVDVNKFNESATQTIQKVEKETKAWTTTIILILIVSMILLFLIASILARGISRSIQAEVPPESQGIKYDEEEEEE